MTTILVATRPERTAGEIAADRKEAAAFFARFEGYDSESKNPKWRDIRKQVVLRERFDYKLLMATKESSSYYYDTHPNERQSRRWIKTSAHWRERRPLDFRVDANLKPYVTAGFRATMPEPRTHHSTRRVERIERTTAARNFFAALSNLYKTEGMLAINYGDLTDFTTGRDDTQRQPYVTHRYRADHLPKPQPHGRGTAADRSANYAAARTFYTRITALVESGRLDAATLGELPFEQWLLCNPLYGPVRTDLPDVHDLIVKLRRNSVEKKREVAQLREAARIKRGQVKPVGMSADRALEIALRALEE
jgi:hypothetical protein